MIPFPVLPWGRLAIAGAALVVSAAAGAWWIHGIDQKKYDKLNAEYASFQGGVAALAEDARQRAARTDATNARNKERADEENRKRAIAVAATVRKLRADADDARRRFLSEAPAGSKCPDGQVCFDAAEFERAHGDLVARVRAGADEGTAMTLDLDTAKAWARDVR
jgi:hypothetical protein